ncbi:GAF domain-containing protein [Myxococcota bacterium]|nr:GAF domain-containing protein [Myxococcota bacterium]
MVKENATNPNATSVHSATNPSEVLSRDTNPSILYERCVVLERQFEALSKIGEMMAHAVGLDGLFVELVPLVSSLMNADRTTLFLYDSENDEIWSRVAEGENVREIRLPVGQGLAGWCAQNRRNMNVDDAYKDSRFNQEVDKRTGYHTGSVALSPIVNRTGNLLGILQVLNSKNGVFDHNDTGLLRAMAIETAFAIENAQLTQRVLDQNEELKAARQRTEQRRAELDLLYDLEQETSAASDLDTMLDSAITNICKRLRSEAGSVLLSDDASGNLLFRAVSGSAKDELLHLVIPAGEGIVGWVAKNAEALIANNPEDDKRHNRELAAELDYPAQALAAVPLIWDGVVLGAVEVLNPGPRADGTVGYDDEDIKVLTLAAGQMSRAIALTRQRLSKIDNERLAAIGKMMAALAHDLRNPMAVISGYTELMAMEDDPDERNERSERILSQVDEMTAMVNDLLAYARGDTQLRPMEINVIKWGSEIQETLKMQTKLRKLTLTVKAEGQIVAIDAARTKRIIFNLTKNAIDILPAGGELELLLRGEPDGLFIRVRDTGPGIPQDVRHSLFEPFVTSGKAKGTGLGLAIAKRFVDDHSGTIDVSSSPGEGTTFTLTLPNAFPPTKNA